MKRYFLLAILFSVLCMGCDGVTVGLPGQPPVATPGVDVNVDLEIPGIDIKVDVVVPEPVREVLFFTQRGCAPCEQAKSRIKEMRKQGLKVTEVDIYENPDLVHQYQITQTPTFIVLEDGVEIERTSSFTALILILVKILSWILPFILS